MELLKGLATAQLPTVEFHRIPPFAKTAKEQGTHCLVRDRKDNAKGHPAKKGRKI
jgi:hypothetical protein